MNRYEKITKDSKDKYYANPNICKHCSKIIEIENRKISEIRSRRYCSRSCAASATNLLRPKKTELKVYIPRVRKPKVLNYIKLANTSKNEIFQKYKNWQSARTCIQSAACLFLRDMGRPGSCQQCGYSEYTEICHIKPVSSFDRAALLSEINDIKNLVVLCPNCHWELDNNILDLKGITNE